MKYIFSSLFLSLYFVSNLLLAKTHNIDILNFKFLPALITINAGDTIRWTNREKRQYHSVWFEKTDKSEPDYFFPGEFYEKKFEQIGEFSYLCGPHPKMTGTVYVISQNEIKPDKIAKLKLKREQELLHLLKHDCGSCHGMTLAGGLGPALRSENLEKLTINQIALIILNGRPGTPMPPWKPFITSDEANWIAKQLKKGETK